MNHKIFKVTTYLRFIVDVCHVYRPMIVKNEENDLVRWIKKVTEVNSSAAVDQETVFNALYIILVC